MVFSEESFQPWGFPRTLIGHSNRTQLLCDLRDRDILLVEEAHPKLDGFEMLFGTTHRAHLNNTFLYNLAVLKPEAAFTLFLLNFRKIG